MYFTVISYSAEVVRDHIEKLIDYLADTVINPLFEENGKHNDFFDI